MRHSLTTSILCVDLNVSSYLKTHIDMQFGNNENIIRAVCRAKCMCMCILKCSYLGTKLGSNVGSTGILCSILLTSKKLHSRG